MKDIQTRQDISCSRGARRTMEYRKGKPTVRGTKHSFRPLRLSWVAFCSRLVYNQSTTISNSHCLTRTLHVGDLREQPDNEQLDHRDDQVLIDILIRKQVQHVFNILAHHVHILGCEVPAPDKGWYYFYNHASTLSSDRYDFIRRRRHACRSHGIIGEDRGAYGLQCMRHHCRIEEALANGVGKKSAGNKVSLVAHTVKLNYSLHCSLPSTALCDRHRQREQSHMRAGASAACKDGKGGAKGNRRKAEERGTRRSVARYGNL